jgi:WD40-like Beta Propeller Repeat
MTHTHFTRRCLVAVTLALLVGSHVAAQRVSETELLFREALHKQQVEGDLGGAIKLYQRIVSSPTAARAVVAKALLQLGDCYEKQGNAEARRAYERLVRDFGDQGNAVGLARARLAELAPRADARRDVTVRRLREWPALRRISSVSRDGRYATIDGGEGPGSYMTQPLLLHDLTQGTSREIGKGTLLAPNEVIFSSAVSPDGSQVAYTSVSYETRGVELRIVGVTAGEPRILHRHSKPLMITDWSRDGSTILLAEGTGIPGPLDGFLQLNVATGRLTPVGIPVKPGSSTFLQSSARLSPDARFVAYSVPESDDSRASVVVATLDGASPRRIPHVSHGGSTPDSYPAGWTPDGKRLLYVSNESGSYDLLSVTMRDGSPVGDPRVVKKPFGQTGLGRVDDSGRVFHTLITRANTGYLGELDVTKTDARVENIQPVPTTPSPRDSPNNLDWSPDGTRIRIARFRSDSPMWIRDVATGREREIKPPEGYSYLPSATNWTPDGRSWVTILGGKDLNELKLAWADVDSGTFRIGRTLSQFWHQNPIQSPDGLHVYAVKHFPIPSDTRSLLRINVETGEEREICRGRGDMRVSPDFSHAACFNGDGIRLVSLTGGAERATPRDDVDPRWQVPHLLAEPTAVSRHCNAFGPCCMDCPGRGW